MAAVAGKSGDEDCGLRFMQPSGELSGEIVPGFVSGASWLPDGSGIVVTRRVRVATWQEAAVVLPPDEVGAIERGARVLASIGSLDAVQELLAQLAQDVGPRDLDPFRDAIEAVASTDAFMVCARDRHPAELQAAVRETARRIAAREDANEKYRSPDAAYAESWAYVQKSFVSVWELTFVPVANGAVAGPTRTITRTLLPLSCPAVSPRSSWVAVRGGAEMKGEGAQDSRALPSHQLLAVRLDDNSRLRIANDVVSNPVWLADGMTLVYATAPQVGTDQPRIHTLLRRRLAAGDDGEVEATSAEGLAIGIFSVGDGGVTLAGLPNDRLLFGGIEAAFPARLGADGLRARLFVLDASAGSTATPVAVPTAAGALPDNLGSFAVSPDGEHAALVEWNRDAVAVVDLKTGSVTAVAMEHAKWKCGTLPAWRNSDELLIETLPSPDAEQSAWAIHRCGKQAGASLHLLSTGWTDRDRDTLLWNSDR